jgi:hypothetical protein
MMYEYVTCATRDNRAVHFIQPDVITIVTSGEERYAVLFSLSPATFHLQSAWQPPARARFYNL